MSKCKTVTLRKRKIKNGTQYSLCLDYYPGYRDNITMRVITREALGIYIFVKPANQQERDFNTRMMKKAAILRNQRYEWKSHATLTLLAKQDCPLWLQYD